ncbi:hypothetical protein C8Q80DRAFT_1344089 [Daedaleopsis nitida]|nr:hypothetical protein C8Q80DRAFT_1344089 [Daedaleopsis nitida]
MAALSLSPTLLVFPSRNDALLSCDYISSQARDPPRKRSREDMVAEEAGQDAKRVRSARPYPDAVVKMVEEALAQPIYSSHIPTIPGLPKPWERFTESATRASDGGTNRSVSLISEAESTFSPHGTRDWCDDDYDSLAAHIDPSLSDDVSSEPLLVNSSRVDSQPCPVLSKLARYIADAIPLTVTVTPISIHSPKTPDSSSSSSSNHATESTPPAPIKPTPRRSSPKGTLRAMAHLRVSELRRQNYLQPSTPPSGYHRDSHLDTPGTPCTRRLPLVAPAGSYVYDIAETEWLSLSIRKQAQCTRQVFLGGASSRTAELVRIPGTMPLDDRLTESSLVRHTLRVPRTGQIVSAFASRDAVRFWTAHASKAWELKGKWKNKALTTSQLVPEDVLDGSVEKPQPLADLDLPAFLQGLEDECEDGEDDMEDVEILELSSEACLAMEDWEREIAAEGLAPHGTNDADVAQEDGQESSSDSDDGDNEAQGDKWMSYDEWLDLHAW